MAKTNDIDELHPRGFGRRVTQIEQHRVSTYLCANIESISLCRRWSPELE